MFISNVALTVRDMCAYWSGEGNLLENDNVQFVHWSDGTIVTPKKTKAFLAKDVYCYELKDGILKIHIDNL